MPPVPKSDWIQLTPTPEKHVTIASWNILAQCLIQRTTFPYVPKKANPNPLSLAYRLPLLKSKLASLNADILALQEMDLAMWELGNLGLKKYLEETMGMDTLLCSRGETGEGVKPANHGIVIAWKRDKFELAFSKQVNYDGHELAPPSATITPWTRNIGMIGVLRSKSKPDSGIIVTNTHLFWRPQAVYEKLRQLAIMMHEIQQVKQQNFSTWPFAMCGDFNMVPYNALYRALTIDGPLEDSDVKLLTQFYTPDLDEYVKEPEDGAPPPAPKVDPDPNEPPARIPIYLSILRGDQKSVPPVVNPYRTYRDVDPVHADSIPDNLPPEAVVGTDESPWFTTFSLFVGTLDYVFLPKDAKVHALLRIPSQESCLPGLPNKEHPSDHIPVAIKCSL